MSEQKPFEGLNFTFTDTLMKRTTDILKLIKQNGGTASYMLTKKV
jgi:hypothetical protein